MPLPLWSPSPQRVAAANLTAFMRRVEAQRGQRLPDYRAVYQWSIDRPQEFWQSVWDFCGVIASRKGDAVTADYGLMPGTRWFPGARLNFAQNLLRWRDAQPALIFGNERGQRRSVSFAELHAEVARAARTLRAWGVQSGDRVAAVLPNLPETVVAMLAVASLGAVWSSTSPDFGLQGALDRLGQIGPKVLFVADGYPYGGKEFDTLERSAQLVERLPTVERVVVVPYNRPDPPLARLPGAILFPEFLGPEDPPELSFEQLPFDHPLYILYSSGTTGPPKCIVHGAGGTLIQHLKEHVLHVDLKRDDRILYFTTCGWMMWNWLVSCLAVGATVVLYDGSPYWPRPDALFDLLERERITVFGTSPKYLSAIEKAGVAPIGTHDLAALRTILSTGSPLAGESYDYVYQHVKPDVCLASISGGTDIVACFAAGNPLGPVYRGELQARALGMKVLVYDDEGRPLHGQKGELVCAAPFPSLPLGFWNDPAGEQYKAAYFDRFPNVWRHGDWVELTERDGMIFYGRSDAVLNPGGVRIGTAEIYRAVEQLPEVLESIAVGQDWQADVRVALFVKLRPGVTLDEALAQRIKDHIRGQTTPRHVPAKVLQVADIPRTISGKIVELAVREVIHGRPVKNRDALSNPDALAHFANRPELQDGLAAGDK